MIMSKISTILTLEPPAHSIDVEKKEVANISCPYCFGQGGWIEQIGYDKYEEHTCKVCNGAKKIKAVITIEWLPDNNNNNNNNNSLCAKE